MTKPDRPDGKTRRLANLRPPFQKGNPGGPGRPKADVLKAEVERLALEASPAALEELIRIGRKAKSEMARIVANDKVMDRAMGKARQTVKNEGNVGGLIIVPAPREGT